MPVYFPLRKSSSSSSVSISGDLGADRKAEAKVLIVQLSDILTSMPDNELHFLT